MNERYSQIFHLLFYKVVAGKARIETKIAIQMGRKEKLRTTIYFICNMRATYVGLREAHLHFIAWLEVTFKLEVERLPSFKRIIHDGASQSGMVHFFVEIHDRVALDFHLLGFQVLLLPIFIIAAIVIGATNSRQISWGKDLFGEDGWEIQSDIKEQSCTVADLFFQSTFRAPTAIPAGSKFG